MNDINLETMSKEEAFKAGVRQGWLEAIDLEDETAAMGFIFGGLTETDLSEQQMMIVTKIRKSSL